MAFAYSYNYWPTVAAFEQYIGTIPPEKFAWVEGFTLHHTWSPTLAQWQGKKSMEGMRDYYKGKGWTAGPHLYVAIGAPKAAHDGIFQMTPITRPGVHATICNPNHMSLEVAGNYDRVSWTPQLSNFLYDLLAVIFRRLKLPAKALNGHRNCKSTKTCPGASIDMDMARRKLAERLAAPTPTPLYYRVLADATLVRALSTRESKIVGRHNAGEIVEGSAPVPGQLYKQSNTWVPIRTGGYIWSGLLSPIARPA